MNNGRTTEKVRGLKAESALPDTAVLEMTYSCNHKCLYCSCPWDAPNSCYEKAPELSVEEWCEPIKHLVIGQGVCRLCFTGGEPTLKEGLPDIMRFASRLQANFPREDPSRGLFFEPNPPELYFISNGRNFDSDWHRVFIELGVHVSISLPGISTYFEHTGQGSASEALRWMKILSKSGLRVTANLTITKINLFELFETIGNALLHGATFLLMNRFLSGGRGIANQDRLSISGREFRGAIRTADEVLKTANRPGSLGTEVPKCLVADLSFDKLVVGTRCAGGREFFAIDPSGRVRPCNHSPVQLGNWRQLHQAIRTSYWRRFLFREFLPNVCRGCNLIADCDGGCREAAHIVGGSLTEPDPILPAGRDWRETFDRV